MPGTRRTPIARQAAPQISSAAVDLFERGIRLMRRKPSTQVEDELRNIWQELHLILGLQPWQESPLDCDEPEPPSFVTGELAIANWCRSRGIRLELEAALRARREARREARRQAQRAPEPELAT